MHVLVSLNTNGNSREENIVSITASGQKFEENPRILTAHRVDNVICLFDDFDEKQKVYMDIIGKKGYGLTVNVADQETGDNLIRKLCEDGYLDLTCYDVCMENFEEQGYL